MATRKNDIIMLAVICAAGILGCIALTFGSGGDRLTVYCDGRLIGSYDMNRSETVTIETEYGRNVLQIEDGEACVTEADCSGGECMAMRIKKGGAGTIVCVPNKLVIKCERRTETGAGADAVAK